MTTVMQAVWEQADPPSPLTYVQMNGELEQVALKDNPWCSVTSDRSGQTYDFYTVRRSARKISDEWSGVPGLNPVADFRTIVVKRREDGSFMVVISSQYVTAQRNERRCSNAQIAGTVVQQLEWVAEGGVTDLPTGSLIAFNRVVDLEGESDPSTLESAVEKLRLDMVKAQSDLADDDAPWCLNDVAFEAKQIREGLSRLKRRIEKMEAYLELAERAVSLED